MESTSAHEGADISEGMVLQIMAAGTGRLQNVTQNLKQALLKKPRSMELISVVPQDVTNPMGEVVVQEMSFQLHEENLKHVMSTVEPGVPVAFVSVVGAFRSGKSFLLSCFLESLKTNDSDDTFENGFLGGKPGKTDGFSWRGGTKGHTQGITVWSKPFFREVDNGKGGRTKMAVLLVDTQGIFDHDVDTHLDACLFGLSTTLSSCQIFNVRNQVQADNLDSLAVYSEYGAIAKQNQTGGGQQSNAPFQRLEILIRNWQNWEDTADPMKVPCKTLRKKFVTYLDGILARRTAESAKVKECFRDDIGCFGLPHPGKDVEFHDFDGDINKIDEGFRRLVTYYVKNVIFGKLKTTNVPSLRYGGADVFVSSVKDIVQLFSDGLTNGELPDAGSWLGTINAAHNYNLMEEILNVFKGEMDKHTTAVMNPATLQTLLEEHKTTATGSFEPRGDEATKKEAKEVLLARLEKEANRMEARNSARMTWLGKGIAAIVDFFAAFGSAVQAVVSVVMVNLCVAGFCVVDWPQWAICAVGTFVGTVFPSLWGGIEEVGKETGKVLKSVSTFLQFLPPLATILIILVLAMIANVVFNFATLKVDSPYFTFANSSR